MARTPEELDRLFDEAYQLGPKAQEDFINRLSDPEYEALSSYTNRTRGIKDSNFEIKTLDKGRGIAEPGALPNPDDMTEAEIAAELGEPIAANVEKPVEDSTFKSRLREVFNNPVDKFMFQAARGAVETPLAIGGMTLGALTGSMDPVTAAMMPVEEGAKAIGLPEFDRNTPTGRVANMAARGAGGGLAFPLAGAMMGTARSGVMGGTARTLAASPRMQALSGATGGAGGQIAAESGADPTTQLIVALTTGATPGAASSGIRRGLRSDPAAIRETIDNFAVAGETPSVGMATGTPAMQNTELGLATSLGSSSHMANKVEEVQKGVGGALTTRADALGPEMSNRATGQMILDAQPEFKKGASAMIDTSWGNLEKALPKTTRLDMNPFAAFLNEKSKVSQLGANLELNPNLSGDQKFWNSIRIDLDKQLKANLARTGQGGLPISVVKKLRSKFGAMLENTKNNDVAADVGAIKQAYGILSEAWKDAAKTPRQQKLFADAMADTKKYHEILDIINPVVEAKGGVVPEAVFLASIRGTKDGPTVVDTIVKTLKPAERKLFISQYLRRAAKANPSDPDEFNMTTWATNHTRMDQEAKKALFGSYGVTYQDDLDKLAKAVKSVDEERLKQAIMVGPNVRQTTKDLTYGLMLGAGGYATDHPVLGGILATLIATKPISANLMARFMTSPKVVHWLARNSNLKQNQVPIALNNLLSQARRNSDPEMIEFAETLQSQMGDK